MATINVIDGGRLVVSTGREGALMVTDLSGALPQRVFVADMSFTHVEFDVVERVVVAADGGGSVHMLPIPPV